MRTRVSSKFFVFRTYRCIAPIYKPRPWSFEVCSSIKLEPEGQGCYWTTNFLWPWSRVIYWCNTPTNHDLYITYILYITLCWPYLCKILMTLVGTFIIISFINQWVLFRCQCLPESLTGSAYQKGWLDLKWTGSYGLLVDMLSMVLIILDREEL